MTDQYPEKCDNCDGPLAEPIVREYSVYCCETCAREGERQLSELARTTRMLNAR
jgi:hypothetical protein